MPSNLEEKLFFQLTIAGLPEPVKEHVFFEGRRWRFDFCWPDLMIAVECEGIIYNHYRPGVRVGGRQAGKTSQIKKSRHQTAAGYSKDCEKYNAAAEDGWLVLRYTQKHINSGEALQQIERIVRARLCQQ